MAERDDLEVLSRQWRDITEPVELSVPAALRRRRRQGLTFAAEAVMGAIGVATAIYFWTAHDGIVHRVAMIILLVAMAIGAAYGRTRMTLVRWGDWTPAGVLAFRLRECEVALLTARWTLVTSGVLVAFAAFVWVAATLEWDALPPGFPGLYAAVVAAVVVPLTIWALWRLQVKRAEHARLLALLTELDEA